MWSDHLVNFVTETCFGSTYPINYGQRDKKSRGRGIQFVEMCTCSMQADVNKVLIVGHKHRVRSERDRERDKKKTNTKIMAWNQRQDKTNELNEWSKSIKETTTNIPNELQIKFIVFIWMQAMWGSLVRRANRSSVSVQRQSNQSLDLNANSVSLLINNHKKRAKMQSPIWWPCTDTFLSLTQPDSNRHWVFFSSRNFRFILITIGNW